MTSAAVSWNHVGLCVADLDRSVRFYVEALGFAERNRLSVSDGASSKLYPCFFRFAALFFGSYE